jgi:hypothetical protein
VQRRSDGFFVTGKSEFLKNNGSAVAFTVMFGLVGALVLSEVNNTVVETKLDHLTGVFVPVKVISR